MAKKPVNVCFADILWEFVPQVLLHVIVVDVIVYLWYYESMSDINIDIGLSIKRKREESLITQIDLATKCGITRSSISQIESGSQRLSVEMLYKIAGALGCSVISLLPKKSELELDEITRDRFSDEEDLLFEVAEKLDKLNEC